MRIFYISSIVLACIFAIGGCNPASEKPSTQSDSASQKQKPVAAPRKRTAPASIGFHKEKTKVWITANAGNPNYDKVLAVNRTDSAGLKRLDSIIVPNDLSGDVSFYLPFPVTVKALKDVDKFLFFSYPTQAFAAYEYGELAYTGATNMGRKKDPTPTGLFYCNWKAEETISTFNDEWKLRWNFNIANKLGVGFHQYALPGYPASHSCLRLIEKDAKYLYGWAQQWSLDPADENKVLANGTPVMIIGEYPFGSEKPWLRLVVAPESLNITEATLQEKLQPFLPEILAQQQKRISLLAAADSVVIK